jgi:hypothetical protein
MIQLSKSIALSFLAMIVMTPVRAQYDSLFMHNGIIEEAIVQQVLPGSISFRFKGEDAGRSMSKHAIRKIVYRSGRVELPSASRNLPSDTAWSKVMILGTAAEAEGLRPIGEINSHTAFINFHTSRSGEIKARKKLQQQAAKLNCPFILITVDREVMYGQIKFWGVVQHKLKAIAYTY